LVAAAVDVAERFTRGVTSFNDVPGGIPEVGGDRSDSRSEVQDNSGTVLYGDGREPASLSRKCCEIDVITDHEDSASFTFDF